jgi:hypothetical protein
MCGVNYLPDKHRRVSVVVYRNSIKVDIAEITFRNRSQIGACATYALGSYRRYNKCISGKGSDATGLKSDAPNRKCVLVIFCATFWADQLQALYPPIAR